MFLFHVVLWPNVLLIKILFRTRLYLLVVLHKSYFFEIIYLFFMHDRDGWTKCFQTFSTSNRTKNWIGLIKITLLKMFFHQ